MIYSFLNKPDFRRRLSFSYMLGIAIAGGLCVTYSIVNFPLNKLDINLAILAALTFGLGTRITVPIPRFKSHISISDTLIFLTLMLYGAEAAIIVAGIEAFLSARRFCNRLITVFFNAGTLAVSTSAVVLILWTYGLYGEDQLHGHTGHVGQFFTALSAIAVVQFLINTILASVYDALKDGHLFRETWKSKYVMTFPTYLIGAAGAGALVKLIDLEGFSVMFAAVPVIVFVFLAYKMYLRNVEMSHEQADQARNYAKAMRERTIALRDSEERFRRAFDHAPIGIALVSPVGKWLKTNRALSKILGYSPSEFKSRSFHSSMYQEDLGHTLLKLNEVLSGIMEGYQCEQRFVHKDGSTVWTSWSVSASGPTTDLNNNLIFQFQDITEKKHAERQLRHEATHDSLTGLPNRAHFMKRLDAALKKGKLNPKYRVSVLFIDLDRFKFVNDSLGHFIGDELLCAIANRLSASMRPPDLVARLGGDEFVVLVEGRYFAEKVTRIAERIQKKISSPFKLRGHEVFTSASIGILNVSDEHLSSEDVIRDADTAMYQAKRSGKARHETFDDGMREAVRETLQLETDLRKAIPNNELEVFYQPIFSLADNSIHSLEALVRWNHPTLGVLMPDKFIQLAEEVGLIDSLSEWVLRRSCTEVAAMRADVSEAMDFKLSVNLSSRQFANDYLVDGISSILDETSFPANRLKLEITETVFFEHHERALEMLNKLTNLGITADIDDFGTGYSNLGYLVRLPISTLKIDRSFVMMMSENRANREVVKTVIALAGNLGLKVVAEGVETDEQRAVLHFLGCHYGQGFLFAKPLNAAQTSALLNRRAYGRYSDIPMQELSESSAIQ